MEVKRRFLLVSAVLVWFCSAAFAQSPNLSVQLLTGTHVDTVLNHYFAGEGVVITNGKFNNHSGNITSNQIGTFQRNGFSQFPFESGLVMCTGNATVAAGPNDMSNAMSNVSSSYYETALQLYASSLYDCAALDFDFQTSSDTFVFRYIFASEEYCEYVNSQFNDVFAFILTGPDPVTLLQTTRNVAIIPGSVSTMHPDGVPVAINNVNHGQHSADTAGPGINPSYSQYYIENTFSYGIQFDGYTIALEAGGPLQACATYHMKLAIADVGDEQYDSGVFLEEHSFMSHPDISLSMNGTYCLHDDIVFQYIAEDVDSLQLITPSGTILMNPPFVIHDAQMSDGGNYYLRGKKTYNCNGSPWVIDGVNITIIDPCVPAICNGPQVCAGEVASFPYTYDSIVGPWVIYQGASLFTLNPPATLAQDTVITYQVSMYGNNGCPLDTAVQVRYFADKHLTEDVVACDSYSWNGVLYTTSGSYTNAYESAAGCDSTVTLNLTIHNSVVSQDTLELVENQLPYHFAPADTTFGIQSPSEFQFSYTLQTHQGCDSLIEQVVLVHQNVVTHFDTAVCSTDMPITWRGHSYAESSSFTDTLQTIHGADSMAVFTLTVLPSYELFLSADICRGASYYENGFSIAGVETTGVDSLVRTLTLQSAEGCDSIVHLTLTVVEVALQIIPMSADFCEDMSMVLMVQTPMSDYVWSTGEQSPTITVTAPGYYSVTATESVCTSTASYMVDGCQFELVLPNAITPSRSDGLNDYFCIPPINQENMEQFEISIFNRWGELIYYSTDKNFKWNGEFRGTIQYHTVYNYVIQYTDAKGRPYRVIGHVTVL